MNACRSLVVSVAIACGLALGAAQAQQAKQPQSSAEREAKAREFFTDTLLRINEGTLDPSPRDLEHLRLGYQENLAYGDHQVGRIVAMLQRTGRLDRTIVVVASDHGEAFREHGVMLHTTTLFEEMIFDEGQLINGSLLDYQVASFKDLPDSFRPIIVQVPHETGPFGAKGVGETGTLTVSAAIANAIHDATGVRIRDLPITPERVLRALTEKDQAAKQE